MSRHKHKRNKWQDWDKKYGMDSRWQNWKMPEEDQSLHITPTAYEKMCYYTQLATGEISGFGKINVEKTTSKYGVESEVIKVMDVKIFPQACSLAGTTINGEKISKFVCSLIKQKQNPNDWRLWWHTHNDFGVSWSGIDEAAIKQLTMGTDTELISICINKYYDIIGRKDNGLKRRTLEVRVLPRTNKNDHNKYKNEVKNKVKDYTPEYSQIHEEGKWYRDIDITKPLLIDYKPSKVKVITDRDARELGVHYEEESGLFIRISDGKILTPYEINETMKKIGERDNGLHQATRLIRPESNIQFPY